MILNDVQLKALAKLAKKNVLGHVRVEPIARPGYPEQSMEAITFSVDEKEGLNEGIMDEHGEVVA